MSFLDLQKSVPILEFDATPLAVLEPSTLLAKMDIPENCVITFFRDVLQMLVAEQKLTVIQTLRSEAGDHPIYEMTMGGKKIAVMHTHIGSAVAAATLEELIALGCRKFIACGGAGVLQQGSEVGRLFIPHAAIRDEGASYHYLPPAREVEACPQALAAITQTLDAHQVKYVKTKTWTTDGVYRETRPKVDLRISEGCATVEMECAAFFAVAKFRGVSFAQILYGGDDLSGPEWDNRGWQNRTDIRRKVFDLAAASCLKL